MLGERAQLLRADRCENLLRRRIFVRRYPVVHEPRRRLGREIELQDAEVADGPDCGAARVSTDPYMLLVPRPGRDVGLRVGDDLDRGVTPPMLRVDGDDGPRRALLTHLRDDPRHVAVGPQRAVALGL